MKRISQGLNQRQIKPWLDENELKDDIDSGMSSGIDECALVLVFVTKRYRDKIKQFENRRDNCKREFGYACQVKNNDLLPVVLEKEMLDQRKEWTGDLGFNLGRTL